MELLMSRTRFAAAPLLAVLLLAVLPAFLAGCSLEGLWLQPRSNPRDLYYPPQVVQVYAGNLETPLESGNTLAADTTPLFIEFNMLMDQDSTDTAIRVFERLDRDNVMPTDITWINGYTVEVAPDPTWPAGLEAGLLVLDDAANVNEIPMVGTFTTYFIVPE